MDSESFCNKIIGDRSFDIQNSTSERYPTSTYPQGLKPYQQLVASIVAAQRANSTGNVQALKRLHESGLDRRQLNYDNRNLLHFAAKQGQLDSVKYLVSTGGLDINTRDRWGATPLNYAREYPKVFEFMKTLKNPEPLDGSFQGDYLILASVYQAQTPTDDEFRVLFAVFNDDIPSLQILKA